MRIKQLIEGAQRITGITDNTALIHAGREAPIARHGASFAFTEAYHVQPKTPPGRPGIPPPPHTFLVTDAEERFRRIAAEFLEQQIENLELVTL